MALLGLLSCVTLIGISFGSGAPASDPELNIIPRIINGVDAHPGAWPWNVMLQTRTGKLLGGGSLINENWVVTAAYCKVTTSDQVVAGIFDRSAGESDIQILNISQIFRHPKFNVWHIRNDIALLKLATPAVFRKNVAPIFLPRVSDIFPSRTMCTIMGWGETQTNATKFPDKLQQATVSLMSPAECRRYWPQLQIRTMICAGFTGASSHNGDSGGSMVCQKNGHWMLVGILSFDSGNCPACKPLVATRVRSVHPARLQQANVPLQSTATCKKFWPSFSPHAMICAGVKGVSFYRVEKQPEVLGSVKSWVLTLGALGSGAPDSDPELSITPRIINGTDARPGAWPWHVSVQTSTGRFKCGGSLIDRFWVITAAHCNITTSMRVVTGLFELNTSEANLEVLKIAQVFRYPRFNLDSLYSDIALLKLASPAHFYRSVSPVPLPSVGDYFLPGTWCKITGWGFRYPNGRNRPSRLQEATVPILSVATCRKFWPGFSPHAMLCAGVEGVSFYSGDSGGSLVCPKKGTWTLVGILSFFYRSNPTGRPFVTTRVSMFRPWIDDIMTHN
ncbi:PREDICTED: transmembrane protease serine 9-like [Condylura cristata]|uniref:transmembrane protease serine 9-like n=1 Tax=Condylura cristata TaxID=143302 RepID=UPI0006439471|nr:PREDICTED: transmembrane protease serine 9-like [Condylura cristata]